MADEPLDFTARIEEVAAGPASVSGDAGSISQPNIKDLIAAEAHVKGKAAAAQPHQGLRFNRLVPPGAV